MSTPAPYDKGNISRGSRIPRTPIPQQQAPRTRILDVQKSGKKRKSSANHLKEAAEVLRDESSDKTGVGSDTFSISGPRPRSISIARRKSSALAATSFFDKDLDKMTDSEIENKYKMNERVHNRVRSLRSSVGNARSSFGSVSSEDSFKPSESQIYAEMRRNAILVPPPPKSTDNSGMTSRGGTFTIDGTPLSVSAFENAFKANANIIVPHYNLNSKSNEETNDQSNNSYNPSESKIIEAMRKHGPYVPPIKKSTRRSSFQSDLTDQLSDSVYEREFRKNAIIIAPGIKKSTGVPKTPVATVSSEVHEQDNEQIDPVLTPANKKSDVRETDQITFEVEKDNETFTKEAQPVNAENENNLEENQSQDEISTIVETFDISISKKMQRTTRKSLWIESIVEDSSAGLESTNKLRASTSTTNTNIMEVSKKKDESIMIETQEKMDLIERVPTPKTRSQSQLKGRISRNNKEADVMNNNNEKTQIINHSTPIKKIAAKKKNLNNLNLSAISSQENKGYNSLMSVKKPRLEKKQEMVKLRKKSQISRPILKDVFEISPSASDNEENINHELTLKNDNKDKDDSETSFEEEPEHLPSSCSINNDYDSESSIDGNEKEVEKEKKGFEKPKILMKVNEELADSNDKNKNDASIKKANNVKIKKPKVILPRKGGSKINKATDKLRKKSLRGYEPDQGNSKSPLKVKDPSPSPLKKRLRTSSRHDFNENNNYVENIQPLALGYESTHEREKSPSPLKLTTKSNKAKKKKIDKNKDINKKAKINNLRTLRSNKQAVVEKIPSKDKSLSTASPTSLEKSSSTIQKSEATTKDKNLNTPLKPFKMSVPKSTPDESIRIKGQLKTDVKANQEKTPRNKSRSQTQTQVDVGANINKENTILPNSSSNADQSQSQSQSKKLSSSVQPDVQPVFENEMEPEIIVEDIEATPKPASKSKLKSKVLDHKSIEKSSTSKSASLKISSKYKKKFQLKKRPISARPIELEHEPSSSKTMQLTANANKNKKVKLVKKKSAPAPEKIEYTKLYQLQNRLWGKMNTEDIKLLHRVMSNYIELFLNQIQSNCRNKHGKYTYLELERALAAEGLIPRKKGYLLSYMASIFNTEQMKLVTDNGLFPIHERNIAGNNFPE